MLDGQKLRFTIQQTGLQKLIELFSKRLNGRAFAFEYTLPDVGQPITIENQKLSNDLADPIRLEYRDKSGCRCECLVFVVDDPDDLMIPVPGMFVEVDLRKEQEGIIKVTNNDGEKYRFIFSKAKH